MEKSNRFNQCSKEVFSLGLNEKQSLQNRLDQEEKSTRLQKMREISEVAALLEDKKKDLQGVQHQRQRLEQVASDTKIKMNIAQSRVCSLQKEMKAQQQKVLLESERQKQLECNLKSAVDTFKEEMAQLECQLNDATAVNDELEDECHKLRDDLSDLQERNEDVAMKVKVLNKELLEESKKEELTEASLRQVLNNYESQKNKYDFDSKQNACLRERANEVQTATEEVESEINRKNEEISGAQAENADLEAQVQDAKALVMSLGRKLEDEVTDCWNHKGQLNIAKEEYDRLSTEQHQLKQDLKLTSCKARQMKSLAKSSGSKVVEAQLVSVVCDLCKAMAGPDNNQYLGC